MNSYDKAGALTQNEKEIKDWKLASIERLQYALAVDEYLEDISEIEPSYAWLSTSEARWLTRQDEIINFW